MEKRESSLIWKIICAITTLVFAPIMMVLVMIMEATRKKVYIKKFIIIFLVSLLVVFLFFGWGSYLVSKDPLSKYETNTISH